MLPRAPDLLTVILGTLRAGGIYQPLFTTFGPKAIQQRVRGSGAKLIVTDGANRHKLDEVENCPPVITAGEARPGEPELGRRWRAKAARLRR